jgi:hypothetical protein
MPRHGSAAEDVIFINGINTKQDGFLHALDTVANAGEGAHVLGVFNASRGPARDFVRGYFDHLRPHDNPAIMSLSKILAHIAAGRRPIVLVAHSQGAAVAAQALVLARDQLLAKFPPGQVACMLASLRIETHGAAGCYFIDGPKYVHYVNTEDPVPHAMGLAPGPRLSTLHYPGKNAVFRWFTQVNPRLPRPYKGLLEQIFSNYDETVHTMRIYAQHRLPFDEAYVLGSNVPGPSESNTLWRWMPMRFLIDALEMPISVWHWLDRASTGAALAAARRALWLT